MKHRTLSSSVDECKEGSFARRKHTVAEAEGVGRKVQEGASIQTDGDNSHEKKHILQMGRGLMAVSGSLRKIGAESRTGRRKRRDKGRLAATRRALKGAGLGGESRVL